MSRYWRIYKKLSGYYVFSQFPDSDYSEMFFLVLGKFFVVYIPFVWISSVFNHTSSFSSLSVNQTLVFLFTAFLIDRFVQVLFLRGMVTIPKMISSGDFDIVLLKPVNTIFYSCFRIFDILDFLFLLPLATLVLFYFLKTGAEVLPTTLLAYLFFAVIGLVVAFSVLLIIISSAFKFIAVDNLLGIFRDLMGLAKLPHETYGSGLGNFLTYFVPVLLIGGSSARSILGMMSCTDFVLVMLTTVVFVFLGMLSWRLGLKVYSSASS